MLGRTGLFHSLHQLRTVQWYERVIIYLNSPHVDDHLGFFHLFFPHMILPGVLSTHLFICAQVRWS